MKVFAGRSCQLPFRVDISQFDTMREALLVLGFSGDIAQLGERCVRIAEVGGSNPPIST